MNNAELYHRSNTKQKRDSLQCLEEYGKRIKWKNGRITVIDIGCGDGSVTTSILKKNIPNNCERLLGCDISENMVQFANEHYANDHTSFTVQDIEGDLPTEFRGNFDNAFSFFVLHWIQNQEMAFTNIYDLLKIEGECFLVFVAHTLMFEVYRILSRSTRWKFWLKDVERFISPYHDCQDPVKKVKQMMTSIGFTSVEVEFLQKAFTFPNLDALKGVCLVENESSRTTNKIGKVNKNGSRDYGLFQINDKYWCSNTSTPGKDCNVTCSDLLTDDISKAATCAKKVFKRHGFNAWYGWKNHCKSNLPDISSC